MSHGVIALGAAIGFVAFTGCCGAWRQSKRCLSLFFTLLMLCLLLTLPKLVDHADYRDWNPSSARVRCFQQIYPLVEKFLPYDKPVKDRASLEATNDRLIHLLIKGNLSEDGSVPNISLGFKRIVFRCWRLP